MIFTDTHAHVYSVEFLNDSGECFDRAILNNVSRVFVPNIDIDSIQPLKEICNKYSQNYFPMMGLHPCSVKEDHENQLKIIYDELITHKYYAIGEIGIDLYWDKTFIEEQKQAFRKQIELAKKYNLPIVIHTRNAMQETINIVKDYVPRGIRGIFHCFGGSVESTNEIIKAGFYLGIGGVVTYPKAGLAEVLQHIDLAHLVLETDAPYLTPVPFRGKRNESSYLKYVVEKIAEGKNVTVEEVAAFTTTNAQKIFGV